MTKAANNLITDVWQSFIHMGTYVSTIYAVLCFYRLHGFYGKEEGP